MPLNSQKLSNFSLDIQNQERQKNPHKYEDAQIRKAILWNDANFLHLYFPDKKCSRVLERTKKYREVTERTKTDPARELSDLKRKEDSTVEMVS